MRTLREWSVFLLLCLGAAWGGPAHAWLTISVCGQGGGTCVDAAQTGVGGTVPGPGYALGHIELSDSATGGSMRVPLSSGDPMPVPSGWTAPLTPGGNPVPPSTTTQTIKYTCPPISAGGAACAALAAAGGDADKAVAGAAHCAWAGGEAAGRAFTGWVGTYQDAPNCNGYNNETWRVQGSASCPTGYTPVSTSCNLTNAAVVVRPSDNIIMATRSGNVLFLDSLDSDSTNSAKVAALGVSASGNTASGGNAANGGAFSLVIGTDGKSMLEISKANADGTTTKYRYAIGAPGTSSAAIEGKETSVYQGTGTLTGETPGTGAAGDLCTLHPNIDACKTTAAFSGPSASALYGANASGKTYDGVLTSFKDRVMASNFGAATSGFFTVSVSGSCPTWTFPSLNLGAGTLSGFTVDVWCDSSLSSTWAIVASTLLLVTSFVAFKWAVL